MPRLAHFLNQTAQNHPEQFPLVLLHGFPLDHRMWDGVVAALAQIPVVTLDAPGYGESAPATELGLESYAANVLETLSSLGYEHFVLAGLSMGGYTAQALAAQAPQRLRGLALLDTNPNVDSAPGAQARNTMADHAEGELGARVIENAWQTVLGETTQAERPAVVAQTRQWISQVSAPAIAWAQRSMVQRPDRTATLEALGGKIPAVVIRGSEDATCTPQIGADMARALQCELVTVERAGHMSALEDPQPVADALRSLWERAAS